MSSGFETMIINSQERLVSTDHNRMQAFAAADLAGILYEMFGKFQLGDDVFPGVELEPTPGATPPFSMVIGGLRPYPINGTVTMLVTPGILLTENPTPGTDDGPYQFCRDPGVTTGGVVTLTPGATATRIDVLECQVVDTVLETDSRDIYDTTTGLFTPASVSKVKAGRLSYQTRIGTPGGGFPGWTPGWVPLLVARVPSTATLWDHCDLWDVRNLAEELWNAPFASNKFAPVIDKTYMTPAETNLAGTYDVLLTGRVDGKFAGWRIDGAMCNYPIDMPYVDITKTTANQAAGLTLSASLPWYLYLAFPEGVLWRKYNSASFSPRVPLGPKGIPVVTQIAPGPGHTPVSAIPLPTSCSLGGSTTVAICVASGMVSVASKIRGNISDGKMTHVGIFGLTLTPTLSDPLVTGVSDYTLVDNTDHPADARSVKLKFDLALSGGAGASPEPVTIRPYVKVLDPTGVYTEAYVYADTVCTIATTAGGALWTVVVDVPLPVTTAPGNRKIEIKWNLDPGTRTFTSAAVDQVTVLGWDCVG